jgi:CheY-like chemotaxis protein
MKILLVEDEVHKRDEILACLRSVLGVEPDISDSVSSAVLRVLEESYSLILLDMALATYGEAAEDNLKGHDQAQGGIEVLRALKMARRKSSIIIITQYPNFSIGGIKVKIKNSKDQIFSRYGQDVVGTVLYQYKSPSVMDKLGSILKGMK